ncbi:MAG: membrane protein insertion efficiency factor YidD, partial [Rickettsia sp.]
MNRVLLLIIRFYQYFISPLLGNNCRFHPTCSEYAKEAIATHGILKGLWLTFKRII